MILYNGWRPIYNARNDTTRVQHDPTRADARSLSIYSLTVGKAKPIFLSLSPGQYTE